MPYVWNMLAPGFEALESGRTRSLVSAAQVPLATIVGLYFCSQVMQYYSAVDGTSRRVGLESLKAAREAACAAMDECVAILPRLIQDEAITGELADIFRAIVADLKDWARTCDEPMTLGAIHIFARIYWVHWCANITASNSAVLQMFLYLCEKRRIETLETKVAVGGGGDDDEYERLLGALMRDPRVGPAMLMDGRPTKVSQCVEALQRWCFVPTDDGETQGGLRPRSGVWTLLKPG